MEGLTGVGMAKGMEVERVGSVYRSLRPGWGTRKNLGVYLGSED